MKPSKNLIIAVVVTAVVAGGGGFFGGMKYGQSQTPTRGSNGQFAGAGTRGGNANGPGAAAGARLRGGAGFVNGDILSMDNKSITVKNRAGGSQIIFFAPSTAIGKTTAGTSADLTVGENVMVNGTPNSDGTITATNIQIRPAGSPDVGVGRPNGGMLINGAPIPTGNTNVPNNK